MRPLKLVPDNTNIGFVRLRVLAFGLTIALIVARARRWCVVTRPQPRRRFRRRPDDRGELRAAAPTSTQRARDGRRRWASARRRSSSSATERPSSIRLPLPDSDDEGADQRASSTKVKTALEQALSRRRASARVETVSGKVSGELIRNGVLAVVLAMLGIALFIWFRFEWQFGVVDAVSRCSTTSLMTLGFFALTQLEFDLNIVAAVLTIIGYSINDKIVDRRPHPREHAQIPQDGHGASCSTCRSTRRCRAP